MNGVAESHRAARAVARHLIGEDPTPDEAARWIHAVAETAAPLQQPRDRRLWEVAMAAPWTLGLADAGLALTDPYSPVRQRICLMLAVLEASPAHVARFEARDDGAAVFLRLALFGMRAVARSLAGLALVRTWGLLWR